MDDTILLSHNRAITVTPFAENIGDLFRVYDKAEIPGDTLLATHLLFPHAFQMFHRMDSVVNAGEPAEYLFQVVEAGKKAIETKLNF